MRWGSPDIPRLVERRDLPGLLRVLRSSRSPLRAAAAAGLGDLGSDGAVDQLRALLAEEEEVEVCDAAARALATIRSEASLTALGMAGMDTRSSASALATVEALAEAAQEDERAVAPLVRIARFAHLQQVRPRALAAVGELDYISALVALDAALSDEAATARSTAVAAVRRRMGIPEEEPTGSDRAPIRLEPHSLERTRSTAVIPEDLQARSAVAARHWSWAASLGSFAVEPLRAVLEALPAEEQQDRRAAAEALARIDDARVVPILSTLLVAALADHELTFVRDLVVALARIRDGVTSDVLRRTVQAAVIVMDDSDPSARNMAERRADERAQELRTWEERRRIDPEDFLQDLRVQARDLLGATIRVWPESDPARLASLQLALARVDDALVRLRGTPETLEDAYQQSDSDSRFRDVAHRVRHAEELRRARAILAEALG